MKEIVKIPTDYGEKIKSVLVMVIGFFIIGLLLENKNPDVAIVFQYIGVATGVLTLLSNFILDKIIWLWFSLATVMGYVMSRILLTIVFYLLLFPIAILSRLGSGDGLQLKKPSNTTFTERNHKYGKEDLENIW